MAFHFDCNCHFDCKRQQELSAGWDGTGTELELRYQRFSFTVGTGQINLAVTALRTCGDGAATGFHSHSYHFLFQKNRFFFAPFMEFPPFRRLSI